MMEVCLRFKQNLKIQTKFDQVSNKIRSRVKQDSIKSQTEFNQRLKHNSVKGQTIFRYNKDSSEIGIKSIWTWLKICMINQLVHNWFVEVRFDWNLVENWSRCGRG